MYKFPYSKQALIIVAILVIGFIVLQKCLDHKNRNKNRSDCTNELNKHISGVVSNAYYDGSINVKAFVILFTNGEKYVNPIFLKSLDGYIKEGDSIYKAPGAFKFEIFKKGNAAPVIFEDTVNCEKLKY